MTSLGPAADPMLWAKRAMLSTGRERWPATAEPNQSTSRFSVKRTTGSGMWSKHRPAAKAASCSAGRLGGVFMNQIGRWRTSDKRKQLSIVK
jgi:hypothetical protein